MLQGATERPAEAPFRQNNQFFYLSGVELPRSILLLDGRTKQTTLFLADNERRARMWGPLLMPGAEAARVTGIEAVTRREEFETALAGMTARKSGDLHPHAAGSAGERIGGRRRGVGAGDGDRSLGWAPLPRTGVR